MSMFFELPDEDGQHPTLQMFGDPEFLDVFIQWHEDDFVAFVRFDDGYQFKAALKHGIGKKKFYESRRALLLLMRASKRVS